MAVPRGRILAVELSSNWSLFDHRPELHPFTAPSKQEVWTCKLNFSPLAFEKGMLLAAVSPAEAKHGMETYDEILFDHPVPDPLYPHRGSFLDALTHTSARPLGNPDGFR